MEIDDDVEGEEAEAWSVTVDKKVTPWGQGREGGKSRKGCRETVNSLEWIKHEYFHFIAARCITLI